MLNWKLIGTISLGAIVLSGPVSGHSGATGIVKERMDGMGVLADAVKSVGNMLRGKTPYSAEAVAWSAGAIKAHAGENMTRLFPEGSLDKPTEALPDIWTQWAEFTKLAEQLTNDATVLETGANEKDATRVALQSIANTCKTCHEQFRAAKKH
ncbi:cytochrome c556 [Roseibium hamelinense]|uniref:Cytochrome c556 n=1 Tax=Roseibium hamelinense TaxID=150831 RepID=A0A562T0M7_9HYPH|nr:cytochrome c [Roseibium hamelinense]MTI43818.1 cytochrome c [Roseibium hamelinense]TWI87099.1 cytochrome c556 [Roseibium hamelinense]